MLKLSSNNLCSMRTYCDLTKKKYLSEQVRKCINHFTSDKNLKENHFEFTQLVKDSKSKTYFPP